MSTTIFPIQPIELDSDKVVRFVENRMIRTLLDSSTLTLNDLAVMNFTQQEQEQFAQLIGYSLSGFGELSYTSDEVYDAAELMFDEDLTEEAARSIALRSSLKNIKAAISKAAEELFNLDLE